MRCIIHTLRRAVHDPISEPSHMVVLVLCKAFGMLSMILMKVVQVFFT